MSAEALRSRVLALLAGGWVTPQRLAAAVGRLLDGGGLLDAAVAAADVVGLLERGARRAGRLAPPSVAAALGERLHDLGAALHVIGGPGYPPALAQAWPELGAPLWVSVRAAAGRLPAGPAVAVVGTREPTLDGLRTAEELGRLLARHGIVVVSGLARGIDQAAHRGALAADGPTVGVLGAGFAVDYPRGCGSLREEVADAGGLVTELRPDDPPHPRHFLARNRIVSGLAEAVVVVEGRARSGALATARLAAGQGRDVWAVPGSLRSPASQAPLALIRDGAQVVTRLEDVVEAVTGWSPAGDGASAGTGGADGIGPSGGGGADCGSVHLSPTAAAVLPLLGAQPASPGSLAGASGLPLPAVLAAVTELDARGLAASTARGVVRR